MRPGCCSTASSSRRGRRTSISPVGSRRPRCRPLQGRLAEALDRHEVLRTGLPTARLLCSENLLGRLCRSSSTTEATAPTRCVVRSGCIGPPRRARLRPRRAAADAPTPTIVPLAATTSSDSPPPAVRWLEHRAPDGRNPRLSCHADPAPPRGRYRDYIAWLQGATVAAENYRRALLADVEEPTRLAAVLKPGGMAIAAIGSTFRSSMPQKQPVWRTRPCRAGSP